MKLKTILFPLLLCMGLMPVICSCGDDEIEEVTPGGGHANNTDDTAEDEAQRKMLLGTWRLTEPDFYEEYTFNEDGTFVYTFDDGDKDSWDGTYTYYPSKKLINLIYSNNGHKSSIKLQSITIDEFVTDNGNAYVHISGPANEADNNNRGAVARVFQGSGTKTDPYIISDATELRKLADDVNSGKTFRDEYFKMTADIVINRNVLTADGELNGSGKDFETWIPIGLTTPFCGTLDGNGHFISGIYINKDLEDEGSWSLFGTLAGTLKNIKLVDSYIKGKYVAGFVSKMAIFSSGTSSYTPSITKLINYAHIEGSQTVNYSCAGIVTRMEEGEIDKCANYGVLAGKSIAGICNYCRHATTIKNCVNYGTLIAINLPTKLFDVTGIAHSLYININNCANFGRLVGTDGTWVTAYLFGIGYCNRIENCVNYGRLISPSSAYAIGASSNSNYSHDKRSGYVQNCYYLETSYSWGDWHDYSISMTENQMKSQTFLNTLNSNVSSLGSGYSNWKFGKDGFPTLDWIEE